MIQHYRLNYYMRSSKSFYLLMDSMRTIHRRSSVSSPITLNHIHPVGIPILNAILVLSLHLRQRRIQPLPLNPPRRLQEPLLDQRPILAVRQHQLPMPLPPPAIHHDVLDIANMRVQDDRRDGIHPAQHVRRVAVKHDNIGLRADLQHADVRPPQRQAARPRRQQEGLVGRHGAGAGYAPALQRPAEELEARALQPHARLPDNVGRVGEVRVDAEGDLVQGERHVDVVVAVVHLGLGRGGDVVVVGAQQGDVGGRDVAGVREDDGNGRVEEAERGELGRAVGVEPRAAEEVRGEGGDVGGPGVGRLVGCLGD